MIKLRLKFNNKTLYCIKPDWVVSGVTYVNCIKPLMVGGEACRQGKEGQPSTVGFIKLKKGY